MITAQMELLVDQGTSAPAEVFAAALDGNDRARAHRRAHARTSRTPALMKLPDGSGTADVVHAIFTPEAEDIHERGLAPDVEVDEPDVEFGSPAPPGIPVIDRALERLAQKKAA